MIPQHLSKSVEHYTPAFVLDAAREVLGGIDLDPATCARANEVVRATRFFSEADDGLGRPWAGRVFLNPPGGKPAAEWGLRYGSRSSAVVWWRKLVEEFLTGNVERAVFLGFSLDLLQAAQDECGQWPDPLAFPICVPRKRIQFEVEADAWADQLRAELAGASAKRAQVIEKKLAELRMHVGQIVSGDQPTHGNVAVYVSDDVHNFAKVFSRIGSVAVPS